MSKKITKQLGRREATPGSVREAMDNHEKHLNIAREAGNRAREGDAHLNPVIGYDSHRDFPKDIKGYERSLNIAREAGDRAREGDAYLNLLIAYKSIGDFPKAIECFEKSLNIAWEAGDRAKEGDSYLNLGTAYKSHGGFPEGIERYEKSLNIARKAGDRAREGDAYLNLGIAHKSHGDFSKAIECFEESLNIAREAGDRAGISRANQYLRISYFALGDFLKAAEYLGHTGAAGEGRSYNINVTPPEIDLRGPRALEAYNKALTEGKTRVKRFPIMLIGQDRSGKTSLKKSLQGLQFNRNEDSTVGIDVDPSYFKVTTEIWKAGKKDQVATKEEMAASFEHHVARVVVENLREQELTSEVKTVEKSKVLHSSPTISTEAQSVNESNQIPEDPPELSTAIIHDHVGSSADSFSTTQIETEEDPAHSWKSSGAPHAGDGNRVFQTIESHPAQTKGRDNTFSFGMIPEEIETLIKKLRDEVDKMDIENDIYSVLWDFAGESVYYETHQLFLTSRAIYLLVCNLSRDPQGSAQPVKKQGVYMKIEEKMCTKTNLDYLDYWMTSVSSQSSRIEDHDLFSTSISAVLPRTIPPVFLVCTHSDQPFGGKDPFELANIVYGSLETKSYGTQLYDDVFVVDNTKSGMETECSEVQRLRESILAVAKELPHTREDIPIKWLRYEKALQVMLVEGHKWITIEHAKRIASEVCQIRDHQEFVTVLDLLHDQRILIHFDDTVELNKLVVLDPQWLIDVFKAVITVKPFHHQEREFKEMWLKLEREGILEEKLLQHAWGQMVEERHTFESLIAIMGKFSLLCTWPSSDEPCSKKYLVPSMLRWHPPEEITELIASARLPSLFLKFESGLPPSNLFPRLVLKFLQWWRNEFSSTVNPHLYKNFARFYTARNENCSVVLLCHSSLIEVVFHEGNVRSLKDDLQADLGISSGDQRVSFEVFCAREVFKQLMLLLECLRKEFCWLNRMRYKAGVICPVCCHKRLVKYCPTHHKKDCEREECLHFISESELRNANQPITCTWSAVAVDNKVCIKDFSAWFTSPREEIATNAIGGRLSCSSRESEDKSLARPGKREIGPAGTTASDEKEGKGDEKAIEKEGGNEVKDDRGGAQSEKTETQGQERHEHDIYDDYLDPSFSNASVPSSGEAPKGCLKSTSSRKLRVTLLTSEWGSTNGGLSTMNRELAIQLAKDDNVEVCMYLPAFGDGDKKAADKCRVRLLKAREKPGYDPIDWLASVPSDHQMDVVFGHGIHLGRQVPHIKNMHPGSKWVQVVHTDPEEYGMFKTYADPTAKGEKEHDAVVELCQQADQVVAIGPKLADTYSRSCGMGKVLDLTPGIFSEFAYRKQDVEERRTFHVLVFGSGDSEDFRLKGHDIAARAVAELNDKERGFKLVFVGAPNGKEEELKGMLHGEGILHRQLIVRSVKEGKKLAQEFYEADLLIMPSRAEGFGLGALEALSAGLPVLVSGNSGFGEALEAVPFGENVVVNSDDPAEWAKAIRGVRSKDRKVRLKEASDLRKNYSETYNWEENCSRLIEKIHELVVG